MDIRIGDDARAEATGIVDAALREGRIDLADHERRLVVIQIAEARNDLTPVITDLPHHHGQREPRLRISAAEREQALAWSAEALADGRIEAAEHAVAEARLRRAVTYADLDEILGDLETQTSPAERDQALVRLAEALADGRIEAAEYTVAEDRLRRAVTSADVDEIVGDLDAKASLVERDQVIARIEAAVADGLLDPAERHGRVEAARNATSDAQLAALVADLSADTRSPGAPVRASDAEREAAAARLHDAVKAGLLDLAQFDERVRAVYAARLSSELERSVAGLPEPAIPPEPPPVEPPATNPPRRFRPGTGQVVVLHCVVGFVFFGSIAYAMVETGSGGLAVLPMVVWLVMLVWIVKHGRAPRDG